MVRQKKTILIAAAVHLLVIVFAIAVRPPFPVFRYAAYALGALAAYAFVRAMFASENPRSKEEL